MDDDALTRYALAAQAGDRDAASAFVRATTEQLRRLLRYLTEPEQVEDLVQETYLRAFGALPRYAGRSPARFWLLSIARRVAADHVRKAQRSPRLSATSWQLALDSRQLAPSVSGLVEVREAVAQLDPERREALVLTRVLGLSYAEAALVCDCAVGTIRSRVFRAREDLLAALDSRESEPPSEHLR